MTTEMDHWDARSGGSWAFSNLRPGERHSFRGCFHEVRPDGLVHARMLVDGFESRNAWLASGMESGMNDGCTKLDALLAADDV